MVDINMLRVLLIIKGAEKTSHASSNIAQRELNSIDASFSISSSRTQKRSETKKKIIRFPRKKIISENRYINN